ncbi:MAG: 2Fe-2S iron-sulfur cluster-binding protein [Janthinobacterium lividum]
MARITFLAPDGTDHTVDARPGISVMEAATQNDVPGILGECGGACACATCHVYVDEAWRAATGTPSASEAGMLEFAQEPRENSRLSCQITVTQELDGLVVHTPASQ